MPPGVLRTSGAAPSIERSNVAEPHLASYLVVSVELFDATDDGSADDHVEHDEEEGRNVIRVHVPAGVLLVTVHPHRCAEARREYPGDTDVERSPKAVTQCDDPEHCEARQG